MLFVVGIFGLIIGSFLNAVVWRLHEQKQGSKSKDQKSGRNLSIAYGRSMCPHCGYTLEPRDLVPVLSWLWLRGKCRKCHQPISVQYPLVELLTAILFGLSYLVLRPEDVLGWLSFGLWLAVLAMLIVLTIYDLRWMLLPDVVVLPAVITTALLVVVEAIWSHSFHVVLGPVIAALLASGGFYALAAVSKGKWMGGGDIKLAFLMGLLLGLQKLTLAMFIGFDTAALVGVTLIILRLRRRTDYIPFGPFLAGATVVAYLFGSQLISWYVSVGLQSYK